MVFITIASNDLGIERFADERIHHVTLYLLRDPIITGKWEFFFRTRSRPNGLQRESVMKIWFYWSFGSIGGGRKGILALSSECKLFIYSLFKSYALTSPCPFLLKKTEDELIWPSKASKNVGPCCLTSHCTRPVSKSSKPITYRNDTFMNRTYYALPWQCIHCPYFISL